jgi:hypothetical protein
VHPAKTTSAAEKVHNRKRFLRVMMLFLGWGGIRLQSWKRPGSGFGLIRERFFLSWLPVSAM